MTLIVDSLKRSLLQVAKSVRTLGGTNWSDGSTHMTLSKLTHCEFESLARNSVLSYITTHRTILFKEETEKWGVAPCLLLLSAAPMVAVRLLLPFASGLK